MDLDEKELTRIKQELDDAAKLTEEQEPTLVEQEAVRIGNVVYLLQTLASNASSLPLAEVRDFQDRADTMRKQLEKRIELGKDPGNLEEYWFDVLGRLGEATSRLGYYTQEQPPRAAG